MDRWCSKQDKTISQKDSIPNGMCHCCGEDANTDHSVSSIIFKTVI